MTKGETLPAVDIRLPFLIIVQMPAKDIGSTCRRLIRDAEKLHVHFLYPTPAFAVVAVRAGCHHICPNVLAPQVARRHVIHGQITLTFSTILTGIIIAAKDFPACQFDVRPWPVDLVLQADDGRTRQKLLHRSNVSTSIHDHIRFACQEQADRPPRRTNINRFKICI